MNRSPQLLHFLHDMLMLDSSLLHSAARESSTQLRLDDIGLFERYRGG